VIPANHTGWADLLFSAYIRRLTRRSFHSLRLLGELPVLRPDLPLVLIPNHSTWWDGFFVYLLNKDHLKRRLYLMMLAEQLARFPFFRRVGAFGIVPGRRRSVIGTIRYSASLLQDPGNLFCMFPQGELRPYRVRPLGFQPGLARILASAGTRVTLQLLGMRAEFRGDQLPEVYFLFDEPVVLAEGEAPPIESLEAREAALLVRLDELIASGESGQALLSGRAGIHDRWRSFRDRIGGDD
jgi:1-acyl-sn-glycerol-3-phosphate acyltransferase